MVCSRVTFTFTVTNVPQRRRQDVCLSAVTVNFRSQLQECIACQADHITNCKFKKYKANIKLYFTADTSQFCHVSYNQLNQNSDLKIVAFYCRTLYLSYWPKQWTDTGRYGSVTQTWILRVDKQAVRKSCLCKTFHHDMALHYCDCTKPTAVAQISINHPGCHMELLVYKLSTSQREVSNTARRPNVLPTQICRPQQKQCK
jgi:hypothetical protein